MVPVKKNPVNDVELTYNIILSKGLGRLTRIAEQQIYVLVQNAIRKNESKFFNEDDKKDSIQTSYLNILQNWQSFNPDKTNSAFAYITEVHKRSTTEFIGTWYNKKGLKKEEQDTIRTVSINSSNNGQGLYNL
jgi:hypothetical protein